MVSFFCASPVGKGLHFSHQASASGFRGVVGVPSSCSPSNKPQMDEVPLSGKRQECGLVCLDERRKGIVVQNMAFSSVREREAGASARWGGGLIATLWSSASPGQHSQTAQLMVAALTSHGQPVDKTRAVSIETLAFCASYAKAG